MPDLFHSAALKLTTWYLFIIMVLSVGASLALYHVSSNELERNTKSQVGYFEGLLGPKDLGLYSGLRNRLTDEDRTHLKSNLFIFNTVVLVAGGVISYGLARRTLEPIEEALEAQKRFTADASHELRTPLAAMQSENEVTLRKKDLTKSQAITQIKSNLEEINKLKSLSDGLLTLANNERDNEFYQVLSLSEIITGAVGRVEKTASSKKIKITLNANGDFSVKGSQQHLIDLVAILLDNAIKYSPPGKEVTLSTSKKDKVAHVDIADSGAGIAAKDLPHIFERFYQADTSRSKTDANGYGLGLAIAKKIADTHGAYISVKSAVGKGSTFTLHLPLV